MHARRKQKTFVFDENGASGTGSTASLLVMLKQARKSGQLNLSNRAMTEGVLNYCLIIIIIIIIITSCDSEEFKLI